MAITRSCVLRTILMASCSCVTFGLVMIGLQMPMLFIVVVMGVVWKNARRFAGSSWSHGTARIACLMDLTRHGFLGRDGLILGETGNQPRPFFREGLSALWSSSYTADMASYLFLSALGGSRWVGHRLIRLQNFTHLLTCAPTGRGKGVSVLLPNLLSYPYSCVVTDPKGELYTLSAGIRHHKLKNRIICLDPFEVAGPGSDRLNPLDFVDDKADDFLDQCRDIADMMIMQTGKESEPYWNDSARSILTAFIAFVCACEDKPELRTIDTVRDLLSSRKSYGKAIEIMQQVESHGGVIQRLGNMLAWHEGKELASVLSNVQRHTEAFDSPPVARNLASSTFDPRCLRAGRVTIYLCLSHDKLETLAPLMRLWIGTILRTITRGKPSEKNPVLFFLDEAAHLGKIRVLEQAVTLMRGMGIRLWFFFQSLHQLEDCFGEKAKTILDNIDTQQHFALNDYDNAEALSKRIGDRTISLTSDGESFSQSHPNDSKGQDSGSVTTGWSTNRSDTGRRIWKAEELMVLPENDALIFHRNLPVIPARLIRYYDHHSFRKHGTGEQPSLGKIPTEKAVCLLLASLAFAVFAVNLPHFIPRPVPHVTRLRVPPHAGQDVGNRNQGFRGRRLVQPLLPDGWELR